MSTTPKNLVAALAYAKIGWKVFAIRYKSKAPLTLHGFHDATSCEYILRRWWETDPACGVAVATGSKSGILVLDVDPRNGGTESLAALEKEYGPLPHTVEGATGGGGRHFIFQCPEGVWPGAKGLWPGIDILSNGAYILAPFSVHPTGKEYMWVDGHAPLVPDHPGSGIEPVPPPNWLLGALKSKREERITEKRKELGSNTEKYGEGSRNDTLASIAGTMQRRGLPYEAILAALLSVNALRCDPPLPESEVETIATSISRYAPQYEELPHEFLPPREDCGDEEEDPNLLRLQDSSTLLREKEPEVSWLMEGWIARGDCVLFYGPPGGGKSWLTLELALTAACGLPTFGHFDRHGEAIKVLVIDEENPVEEQWRRLRLLGKAWEVDPEAVNGQLYVSRPCQGFSFKHPGYVRALRERIEKIQPSLVILDSITALSTIRNEADATEVRAFFHDQLYALRNIYPCSIVTVHHSNKAVYQVEQPTSDSGAARGSIDFLAAADCSIMAKPMPNNRVRLKPIKIRRGKSPEPFEVELVDTENGGVRPIVIQNSLPIGEWLIKTLAKHGDCTAEDFKRHLFSQNIFLTKGSLSGTLSALAEKGRIEVIPDSMDLRKKLYKLVK